MQKIKIESGRFRNGITLIAREEENSTLKIAANGAGIALPELINCQERYVSFYLEACEEHSVVLALRVYVKGDEKTPAFDVQFGILPGVRTPICIDRNWMDGHVLFPESNAGQLKQVCHGRRVVPDEIEKIELETLPVFHDITLRISDMTLTEDYPASHVLPEGKLIDELGQNKQKFWKSKVKGLDELKDILQKQIAESSGNYPAKDWSEYGGWKQKKLGEATGFFTKYKADGRWFLADPMGNAFFSMGTDCVGLGADCRVDGVEKWLNWLPAAEDPEYHKMFKKIRKEKAKEASRREGLLFSYSQANLYRALGKNWYPEWQKLITDQLRQYGMNTLGNWSDKVLFGTTDMPYVTSLPEFPDTSARIFRDFPDVLSEEYAREAKRCAQALEKRKNDPLMIGYFLRNEPNWAFVDQLVLADEVLYNTEKTVCKEELIRFLKEKYGEISELNKAYHCELKEFNDFYHSRERVSHWSEDAAKDMREFSLRMLRAYVEIPCQECRKVDPNHMILGMRWAWVSDPELVTGWENFDVFSINCYAVDPTENIQNIVNLGVELPVMIGEFHFGALDAGPTATGLEGVASQRDRGTAYRYYCERVAAHPYGVGCHYFQCYDQFSLGRFDGENYNIGLFDICSQPYQELLEGVKECSSSIYLVKDGQQSPTKEKGVSIPMIAF